jgi:hypothetical protein
MLLEEYDADDRRQDSDIYTIPGEQTEIELQRVSVFGTVRSLVKALELFLTCLINR